MASALPRAHDRTMGLSQPSDKLARSQLLRSALEEVSSKLTARTHDARLSVKDPCSLESRLFSMLSYGISKMRDATTNIYDIAWSLFALRYLGENDRHLSEMIQEALSIIEGKSSEELTGYLYDFRSAVGVALSIYILGREKLRLSETTLEEICKNLVENSERSEIGELIGATFLLLKYLNCKNFEEKVKKSLQKVIETGIKEPEYHLIDLLYVTFFIAILNDEIYVEEIIRKISKNELLLDYIMNEPEALALFLYSVSKAAYLKDNRLAEWSKEKREEAARSLKELLRDIYMDFFDLYWQSNDIKGDEMNMMRLNVEDVEDIDSHYPRPDLVSKILISLYEAGYIYPFMLSKKEADVYRQIKAEVKEYRRVRKYELLLLFALSSLFLTMLPVLWNIIIIMKLNLINFLWTYYHVYSLIILPFIVTLCISIWRNGYVSIHELGKIIKSIINFIRNKSG